MNALEKPRESRHALARFDCGAKAREARTDLRLLATTRVDRRAVGVAIVIHRLPQQRDLDHARVDQALALINDRIRGTMHFGASGVGHDAVGAELVAATSDADIGAARRGVGTAWIKGARKIEELELIVGRSQRGASTTLVAREREPFLARNSFGPTHIVDERGEPIEFAWTAQEINLRIAAQHVRAVALGHATEHAEDHRLARFLALGDKAKTRIRLVFSLFPHRAGVVEHDVGARVILDELVTQTLEMPTHEFAVELIHLAAEGFEIDRRVGAADRCRAVTHEPCSVAEDRAATSPQRASILPIIRHASVFSRRRSCSARAPRHGSRDGELSGPECAA